MTSSDPYSPRDTCRPAFVVGVTGHMDLDPTWRNRIKTEVKQVFGWLRASPGKHQKNQGVPSLGSGLGLKKTPIILLSSLAPGADQWAAEAAREMDPPIRVLAPLPFLKDQYLEASTFKRDGNTKDEAASKFLASFSGEDVFVVRLPDEIDLDDEALRARHATILAGPVGQRERDRRYAAAGEYVAAYSNILIAMTDKPIGQAEKVNVNADGHPGARAIAELKRRGPIPRLLPALPGLGWADAGPVIHLFAPRKPGEAAVGSEKPKGAEPGQLEVLYPYYCRPADVSEEEHDNPDWCEGGRAILKIVAEHLERLNTEKIRINISREDMALAEMLPKTADPSMGAARTHPIPVDAEELQATLDRLARLRRRAADYSAHYNAHLTRLKHTLFGLAFGAAFFFSLADNSDVWASWLPQAFFVIAFGLTLAAWVVYFRFKKTAAAERSDDYRAITEGLRVQFYWTACGSGESVASNYLQRQRGELGWIRHVINVAAFPHEPNRVRFNRLSRKDQLAILLSIRTAWIDGQHTYFKDKLDELSLRRDVFTTYAHVLLWTGFLLFAWLVFFPQRSGSFALSPLLALLALALGTLILGMLARRPRALRGGHLFLNSLLIAAFALLAIGTIYLLGGVVPTANKLGSILKYLALAGGVLCGAWIEVNFFAEQIRQYASMVSLFQAASQRFDDYFNWCEEAGKDQEKTQQVVADIQSLFVAVGREALSENADWLIIHRARPLEPVSV